MHNSWEANVMHIDRSNAISFFYYIIYSESLCISHSHLKNKWFVCNHGHEQKALLYVSSTLNRTFRLSSFTPSTLVPFSVFYQIPLFTPPFLLLKSPNSCKKPSWWFLLNPVVGRRGRGCWLSLGFPLKVVEEGGAIKVRSLEPPCFLFLWLGLFFFY